MFDGRRLAVFALASSIALPLAAKPTPAPKATPAASASVSAAAPPPPAPPSPSAAPEEVEARKHFDIGLKLYKEKLYEAALVEFEQSYKIVPRPGALRNVAQCQRDLKRFADAYAAYETLLAKHGSQLAPGELAAVKKAIKDLESVTGTISFEVNEPGATVTVDGRDVGTTPLPAPVRVDVGPHLVRVTKTGYEAFDQQVKVLATQALSIDAKLTKDIKTGKLIVNEKSGAAVNVWIDDIDRGPAPATVELSPGAHIVELRGEGLASPRKMVEIVAKVDGTVTLEATALRGRLRVETFGKKGTIYVDDKKVGEGTWEAELSPGTHRVKVVAPGYEPHERLVAIEVGQTVVDAVTLAPIPVAPPPPPPPAPVRDPYLGLYGRLALLGGFSLTGAGESVRPGCDDSRPCASVDDSKPMGAGVALHVGHSFGVFSAELVGAFLADVHETKRTYTGQPFSPGFPTTTTSLAGTMARTEKYEFLSLAGFAGVGGRATSKDDAVRFTIGAALGAVYRNVNLKRAALDDEWRPGATGYFAPALFLDAGLLLGNTPGFKLSVGINAWIDFPGSALESSGEGPRPVSTSIGGVTYYGQLESPPQQLRSSTQIYIGPTLGFQFGR
ncbi:MAG: PEGA domain-containing protein [Deltaproteobacteria bacterium]|nr:PEGA domain-containing protein [Deltaproteobacteria bacterium]